MAHATIGRPVDEASYRLASRLSPYVRAGMEHWRPPWFIANRKVLDYLLVYITAGTGRFSVGEVAFDVKPGDLIWIPPDTFHEMRGHAPKMLVAYIHFDLAFDPERSPRVAPGFGYQELGAQRKLLHPPWPWEPIASWCGLLPVADAAPIYALLKLVILESLGAHRTLRVAGLMLQLLDEIHLGLTSTSANSGEHGPAMRRAAQQIAGQPEAELDLRALAKTAHVSLSHFRKLFRETHGMSPRAMHDRVRMQKACELVLHSGWSLTKISEQLGFSTVHNFSRAFKRELGVSPRAYRRRTLSMRPL